MITILQRQNVSKRTAPSVPARARPTGVRWTRREISAPRPPFETAWLRPDRPLSVLRLQSPRRLLPARREPQRARGGEKHGFLRGQLVRRTHRRAERPAERRELTTAQRPWGRALPAAAVGPRRSVLAGALRSPWLYMALAAVVASAVLVPFLGTAGIVLSSPGPALPASSDADAALYDLMVPDQAPPAAAGTSPVLLNTLKVSTYRTAPGDSLSRIASRFKLNIDTLVSWNAIRDARTLPAGTELSIPNRNGLRYKVRRGDTLQGIARSWGVDLNGILDANMLSSSMIAAGQDLFLPGARMSPNDLNRVLGKLFIYPVQGRFSSYFGERSDPFSGVASLHNGVDIVNTPGAAIVAAMAGTVRAAAFNFSYGNYVIIQHAGGYQTLYGHLNRSVVAKGQKVSQGEKIGELGTTGYSTGPHLHFSIFKNGEAVDPLRFLK